MLTSLLEVWREFWRGLSPSQLFVGSFGLLIVLGTTGFKTLPALYTGPELGWLDALFTATSAVCVTGLIVVDTATYFTTWGQAYVLLLVQLGGLGILTFTSLIILTLGRRVSLRQKALSNETAKVSRHVDGRRLTGSVVRFALGAEFIGALLLFAAWLPRFEWTEAAWHAVFQAISAFCNAGFSTFSDSLMGFAGQPLGLVVVMALIVGGGLGFLTLEELNLLREARRTDRRFRLSLHSQLVLGTTGVLLVGGWIAYATLEWNQVLAGLSTTDRIVNGLFMSVTARTAGFNTVPYAEATDSTNFLTILLMAVGGSPGSTAGGIKTTAFALLGILAWNRMRGRSITRVLSRSVPEPTTDRAVGLALVAFAVTTGGLLAYTLTELPNADLGFLELMFEAASAFNTVGLSMGATGELTGPGRWITIVLMFVGRVGPLSFAAALTVPSRLAGTSYRYAYEDVAVG